MRMLRRGTGKYLLLVGETEIVPTFHVHADSDWYVDDEMDINLTDYLYGDTIGNSMNPELAAGRIIGNTASKLLIPLQTSIRVHNGEEGSAFDRSHALVASGQPDGWSGRADWIDYASRARSVRSRPKWSRNGVLLFFFSRLPVDDLPCKMALTSSLAVL